MPTPTPTATPPVLSQIDPDAEVILVRKSCVVGASILPNCFEYMGGFDEEWPPQDHFVDYWINEIRTPTASTPLLVDIGPGQFLGMTVSCLNDTYNGPAKVAGHITFRGSGQRTTKMKGNGGGISLLDNATFFITGDCIKMAFQDMTINAINAGTGPFGGPVIWVGRVTGGSSTWSNIELFSNGPRLWYDECGSGGSVPVHYFFSSKMTMNLKNADREAFRLECGELWVFGSEISVFGTDSMDPAIGDTFFSAIRMTNSAVSVQLFGTLVRAIQGDGDSSLIPGGTVYGVKNDVSAAFHMHGGNMRVSASDTTNAIGIEAGTSGTVHTPDTAFVIEADTGTATRLSGNPANIKSPFLWQSGPFPPQASDETNVILSMDGKDMFVETDCDALGICTSGDESHLMVYDDDCATDGPWRDAMTGRCRGDDGS
jgi:hypothetical protein